MESEQLAFLAGIFSDETALFRSPAEPDPGDTVEIRLRVPEGQAKRVMLYTGQEQCGPLMEKYRCEQGYEWYRVRLVCYLKEVRYHFLIQLTDGSLALYDKSGAYQLTKDPTERYEYAFRFSPGFHVPEWAKGAVEYQIFTDRFRNGDPTNDVTDREYYYTIGHAKKARDWDELPDDTDIRCFHGGDLQGILDKLDYLQEIGVEVLYLNPIFVSPSSHKYDTQDYEHVDPHFGVIVSDTEHPMQEWEMHNGFAPRYIRRVTTRENLEASDALFAKLCEELHLRGMRIILDGVFNHCGSFNKWMDAEGIYLGKEGYAPGAFQSPDSPWHSYFSFTGEKDENGKPAYEGWWNYNTLPKLNYEGSPELRETIMKVAEKWASPPYRIDGWRLDVAADLGHSKEYNHSFWQEFRRRLKAVNPDLLILAEHYGDPDEWLRGNEWDTVMNYDAFMEPVTWFLTGMEKHSDEKREDLWQDGAAFFALMRDRMAQLSQPSMLSAMNELSNHDHSRFMTRTNRQVGRIGTLGSEAASAGIQPGVFREAVVLQMTWPGAPTIYYGDEAGLTGWTDPDNRRAYPWGHEDEELIALHRDLTAFRKATPMLRTGSLMPLYASFGMIAYARFDERTRVLVALNNTEEDTMFKLNAADTGAPEDEVFRIAFRTDGEGHQVPEKEFLRVTDGSLRVNVPALGAVILKNV